MLHLIRKRVKTFSKEERGATMVEYAILVGLIALVAAGGATTFGSKLSSWFTTAGDNVNGIHNTVNSQ